MQNEFTQLGECLDPSAGFHGVHIGGFVIHRAGGVFSQGNLQRVDDFVESRR